MKSNMIVNHIVIFNVCTNVVNHRLFSVSKVMTIVGTRVRRYPKTGMLRRNASGAEMLVIKGLVSKIKFNSYEFAAGDDTPPALGDADRPPPLGDADRPTHQPSGDYIDTPTVGPTAAQLDFSIFAKFNQRYDAGDCESEAENEEASVDPNYLSKC